MSTNTANIFMMQCIVLRQEAEVLHVQTVLVYVQLYMFAYVSENTGLEKYIPRFWQ